MKYYQEHTTKELRSVFEKEVLGWKKVTTKMMFGCPCYLVNGSLFAFLVTRGIVLVQLPEEEREALMRSFKTSTFRAGKKTVKSWIRIAPLEPRDISRILPFIRASYENALRK